MKVVVTGGAGFIGSNLSSRILKDGDELTVVDNLDPYYSGKENNLKRIGNPEDFVFLKGDIIDEEFLSKAIEETDLIYHLAAQPGVRISVENPQKTVRSNILGTVNLLKEASNAGVKKIIFASSSSVFGKVQYMPTDEKHPKNPISPYGLSKLCCESYCKLYENIGNLKIVILRYFTVYGPGQRPDMAMNIFIGKALKNEKLIVYGDGKQTRDFTYIDDIVDGTLLAGKKKKAENEDFNLGGGNKTVLSDAIEQIIGLCGSRSEVEFIEKKMGDVDHTLADNRKAKNLLGWKPHVTLKQGLAGQVEFQKGNK